MKDAARIGHNNPPAEDPIDEVLAPWADEMSEIENWLDGDPLETDEQLSSCEALLANIKDIIKDVDAAQNAATSPLYKTWKGEIARWKPTVDDMARLKKGLLALIDPMKQKKLDEAKAAERAEWEKAIQAREEADAAARAAAAEGSNIDAEREADAARQEAMDAEKAAKKAKAERPKGMRTVHHHEVTNGQEVINWIIKNDRAAVQLFIKDYVAKSKTDVQIDGVRRWTDKVSV